MLRDLLDVFNRLDPARRAAIERIIRRAEFDIERELGVEGQAIVMRMRAAAEQAAFAELGAPATFAPRWGSN